jgi:hypothetical protein
MRTLPEPFAGWFAARGWQPRAHQLDVLAAVAGGDHALLVAPTGGGKTLAGFLPTLLDLAATPREGLHTVYISPLKALAVDIARNLMAPIADMALSIRVETRTGDTPANRRARQRATPPHILLTTPESLTLLLSLPDAQEIFAGLMPFAPCGAGAGGEAHRAFRHCGCARCLARLVGAGCTGSFCAPDHGGSGRRARIRFAIARRPSALGRAYGAGFHAGSLSPH